MPKLVILMDEAVAFLLSDIFIVSGYWIAFAIQIFMI
jgi:hypothetical protein